MNGLINTVRGGLVSSKIEQPVVDNSDIVISNGNHGGAVITVRPKQISVNGKTFNIDPYQLIRMIKNITQTIGEYKSQESPYAAYVVNSLRKTRASMCDDLTHHFRIHWEIDEKTGKSKFWM